VACTVKETDSLFHIKRKTKGKKKQKRRIDAAKKRLKNNPEIKRIKCKKRKGDQVHSTYTHTTSGNCINVQGSWSKCINDIENFLDECDRHLPVGARVSVDACEICNESPITGTVSRLDGDSVKITYDSPHTFRRYDVYDDEEYTANSHWWDVGNIEALEESKS
jgi:sugar phosphate isomerase/epimerase